MEGLAEKTVASLVTENIKTAHIFKKYGINFCCGGSIGIKTAAQKAKIDYQILKEELLKANSSIPAGYDYSRWSLDFLIDHIVNIHHSYIRENTPLIIGYASRVVRIHAGNYPELIQIQRLFSELSIELSGHLKKEENILFPYIKKMVKAQKERTPLDTPSFDLVGNPINLLVEDHRESGAIFKRIVKLSDHYTPPADACNIYKALYAKLEEFEQDLHTHVHLENNILFPRALKLEKELMSS